MRAHLVGIAGAGQRALAELLLSRGDAVTGSDVRDSPVLDDLRRRGATVYAGHAADQVGDADVVVVSSAVPPDNAEIAAALARGYPVLRNAEMLGRLVDGKRALAVAGTHGKTTTTGMMAWALSSAGLDPSFVVGGELRNAGVSGCAGAGDLFVVEADEFDRRFLSFYPAVAIVLNIEVDHLDYFGTEAAMRAAFAEFAGHVEPGGLLVTCSDDPGCRALHTGISGRVSTYGFDPAFSPEWTVASLEPSRDGSSFEVLQGRTSLGRFSLRLLGRHNVLNALAVIAACSHLDVPTRAVRDGIASYAGTGRRFEVVGERRGVRVVVDYAHLPSEIHATLGAARQTGARRVWACFQPHTYARTRLLMDGFSRAFSDAGRVVIVRTYVPPGRETPERDVLAMELAERVGRERGGSRYVATTAELIGLLTSEVDVGDLVLLLGAGDIADAGPPLLAALGEAGT